MRVRRFHPGQLAGGILLCALAVVAAGCYEEIAYVPNADTPSPDAMAPAATAPLEASTDDETLESGDDTSQVPPSAPTAADTPPADRYALADAMTQAASTTSNSVESELFADDQPEPATSNPSPAQQSSRSGGTLLPWETEEPAERTDPAQATPSTPEEADNPPRTASKFDAVFPWDEPAETEAPEESPEEPAAPPSEVQPSSASEQMLPPLEIEPTPPTRYEEPTTHSQSPVTSRHAAWLLGSKFSYALLATPTEGRQVVPELQPLAHLLGVELPPLDYDGLRGTPAGMSQLLSVGRDVGERLAARHDPSHAALVEIALKSNLLMAVHAERPHLAHSVGGAVAAACVRAGIPEEIWQPWQDSVAAGGSTDEITLGVLELHRKIDSYLQSPPNEASEAILR